ncbi:hypothetical protein M409DRAFT_66536 [Zasmidium cellare ATCC 36951]|uniref:DAPG hydrolase PhiG domain-containing protein n=1 Tax=Zasmidium cellare ATCC 36951 TaxID=1080233 RepID=A0A6A6CHF9_ZASCE|nr:uncharacterized protein M409DRAFT_66536 [Zasmidium cellare ATCC 36951]KAF2166491.1 hypothetical protein M409DRAFT_66536 [Zasmidium cellare ATCC 36951]
MSRSTPESDVRPSYSTIPLTVKFVKIHAAARPAEHAMPLFLYWNPNVQPINEAFQKGLSSSPWANALTYTAHEAHEYFTRPGYDELENGWSITENGTLMIAVRSEIPQVTGQAYDWWFSWHSVETARYKLWNPVSHQYSWREPQSRNWTGLSYQDRYINTTSYVDEYVGSNAAKLSIGFIEPESVGFDQSRWPELNIETIVVGQVLIGNYTETAWDRESYSMHQVRRMPNGYRELRSRFWIAKSNHGSAQLGHDLAVHCNIEMTRK